MPAITLRCATLIWCSSLHTSTCVFSSWSAMFRASCLQSSLGPTSWRASSSSAYKKDDATILSKQQNCDPRERQRIKVTQEMLKRGRKETAKSSCESSYEELYWKTNLAKSQPERPQMLVLWNLIRLERSVGKRLHVTLHIP
jgi:hypothetical protein